MYVPYNPNPQKKLVGDCVIRAICKLTGKSWEDTYMDIVLQGYMMHDMPTANAVWGAYLHDNGYSCNVIPNTCPDCYSVKQFCDEVPKGTYLLATGSHVVTVEDGNYFDSWDSGDEVPIYYWHKEENVNGIQ